MFLWLGWLLSWKQTSSEMLSGSTEILMRSKMLDVVVSQYAMHNSIGTYTIIYHTLTHSQPRRKKLAEVNTIHVNTAISACKDENLEVGRGFLARILGLQLGGPIVWV